MRVVDPRLPATLRALREQAGLSLRDLARIVYSSRSHLHDIEQSRRKPPPELLARLDDALKAGGRLTAMIHTPATVLDGDQVARLHHASRTNQISAGGIAALADLLAAQRRLDDAVGSGSVLPAAAMQLDVITGLVRDAADANRRALVDVAGQWAQFVGWLYAAVGDAAGAERTWAAGLAWTAETGDTDLAATILSFRGYAAEHQGQVGAMISLSQAAQRQPGVHPGQLACSAGQEARGMASCGHRPSAVLGVLDRSAEHATRQFERPVPPWNYFHTGAFFLVQKGVVLLHLADAGHPGYAEKAVELLATGLAPDRRRPGWSGAHLCDLGDAHAHIGDRRAAEQAYTEAASVAATTGDDRLAARASAGVRALSAPSA
ncbi:helix-turn-helix transcriptional regulator [Solwaraspora sp. WMMA2080]|uniref:helix-turn-helix domain-containing protein n=1 Tax=unclassified Solwaraspora TaxID=2627926 RepID=UPI00248CC64E|nr:MULTISPECIES: helix-turn-helix transcriptional regulator [unclassified Solwaraspora]WBB97886.1 helix-turn-helix transcriptional regulator [Solwaraspora sp. WMMA2059]WBC23555.1 helix-turn-helix transcriptional regulator [Solwaraspora sp. WMMA2080]